MPRWLRLPNEIRCPVYGLRPSAAYNERKCRCDACVSWNRTYSQKWRDANRVKCSEYQKRHAAKREGTERRLAQHRASNRRGRKKHRERDRLIQLKWRAANRAKCIEYTMRWQAKNIDRVRSIVRRRRARKLAAPGHHTLEQSTARWAYYGGRCYICHNLAQAMDHVIPLARGGSDWASNLRPACKSCNSRKGAR